MLALVVDTSTPAVTTALVRVGGAGGSVPAELVVVVAQRVTVDARAHGERLAPLIHEVLASGGVAVTDLAAIVAGVGPGPFTGLRVGLVTAAALGQGLAIPTYGVCSLHAIGVATTGDVLVATDARRSEVYWAAYRAGRPLTEPAVDRPEAVVAALAERGLHPSHAVGEGAQRYRDVLGLTVPDEPRYPPAAALAALASNRILRRAPADPLTPLYLRRPDAVEPAGRTLVVS